MKTDRDLNYRLYIQKNDGFMRSPFERELSVYRMVQAGDIEGIKKRIEIIRCCTGCKVLHRGRNGT